MVSVIKFAVNTKPPFWSRQGPLWPCDTGFSVCNVKRGGRVFGRVKARSGRIVLLLVWLLSVKKPHIGVWPVALCTKPVTLTG